MTPIKIIILVESYFQQRDYRRYGVEILLKNGFVVEVWEVFRPWRTKYANTYRPTDPSSYSSIRHLYSIPEVCASLRTLCPSDVIIASLGQSRSTAPIYRCLENEGLFFGGILLATAFPGKTARQWRPKALATWIKNCVCRVLFANRSAQRLRFVILCGGTVLGGSAGRAPLSGQVWGHALDYDIFLEAGGREARSTQEHIVFLDEYVPFHPDYLDLGIAAPNTAEEYYPKLNQLFDRLEHELKLPVVIAAHPRAKYENSAYFDGRRIVGGDTCAMVRKAALVVSHCSTANNFTVIYGKPSLSVLTNGLRRSFYGPYIQAMAYCLGGPMINIDTSWELDLERLLRVDEARRSEYYESIIKRPGTPEKNTWQIFTEFIHRRVPDDTRCPA